MSAKSFALATFGSTGTRSSSSTDLSIELCVYAVADAKPPLMCWPSARNGMRFDELPSSQTRKMTASAWVCVYARMRGSSVESQVSPALMFELSEVPDGQKIEPCMSWQM